jgi:RNA polymerase sigma-70 factor (ECF subfamily)
LDTAPDDFDYDAALAACSRGDQSALRSIYDRDGRRLLGVALRIVRHQALDVVRGSGREVQADEEALVVLDTDARESILYAYVDGCSHAEIAARMASPLGTIKAWIKRGLSALKECMG